MKRKWWNHHKKYSWKSKCLAAAILSGTIFTVSCHTNLTPEQRTQKHSKHIAEHLSDELELEEEQQQQIQPIVAEVLQKRESMTQVRDEIFEEILSQLRKEQADEAQMVQILNANKERLEEWIPFLTKQFSKFHAVLTPEQREQLAEELEKHKDRRGHRRHW